MPKDKKGRKGGRNDSGAPPGAGGEQSEKHKLKRKDYEKKLRELPVKLVELQEWVRREDKKICLSIVPFVERTIVGSGIILLKYWLEVSSEEQEKRLKARIDDGRKPWKLSKMDLKSSKRWDDYTHARDEMFMVTDTPWAPWFVARSDDKSGAVEHYRPSAFEHSFQARAAGKSKTTEAPYNKS